MSDEAVQVAVEGERSLEVCYRQRFALEDREPLFDLDHPRAVHGREVQGKSRVALQPGERYRGLLPTAFDLLVDSARPRPNLKSSRK